MKKILIIDDDADILQAIQMILEEEGYSSEISLTGQEIMSKIALYKPDLIILDMLLSGNDGRTICHTLKTDSTTKHLPIIMTSAHPKAKDLVKESEADGYISKPFAITDLIDEIKKYLG